MSTQPFRITISVCAAILVGGAWLASAGPLDPPPGPIDSTGRFGPRTEVSSATTPGDADSMFKITEPGSYYLTGNITGEPGKSGTEIAADNVTLDLNGFALIGVPDSLDGIAVPSYQISLAVRNGTVRDWAGSGVSMRNAKNSLLEDLRAYRNVLAGMYIGDGGVIQGCTAQENGGDGIRTVSSSSVSNCTAYENTGHGIFGEWGITVRGCAAQFNSGFGIFAGMGSTVCDCACFGNGNTGIDVDEMSTVANCTASQNQNDGISAYTGSTVSKL
jgi:parallel beta-helix repeat protein